MHRALAERGIEFKRYPGSLLLEPGQVLTRGGAPFRVFSPFWRACQRLPIADPVALDDDMLWSNGYDGEKLDDWDLTPGQPDWAAHWTTHWRPGEQGAWARAERFFAGPVADYATGRDRPADAVTSQLSPHLHHGEISPRQLWAHCEQLDSGQPELGTALAKFRAELGWREFSYHLLHFFPSLPERAFNPQFEHFPWHHRPEALSAWQRGQTGYPIVDAGMRELWHTGHMHNRVRMVAASFLCKHLLIHWQHGAAWFWDTLLDADLASNSCSWQWVAGSGADAAPYFRIFNPVMQGEKFDGEGHYVRRWVPEIARLPDRYLHHPWDAPAAILAAAGVELGTSYPKPMVEHRAARQAALDAYGSIKVQQSAPASVGAGAA